MIPKIIHYCWFGRKEIPAKYLKYIKGWQKLMPNYQYIRWDESNSPLFNYYLNQAEKHKKWANMSNYIRLYALWQYGGIYLDTDVEVLKSFDTLLDTQEGVLGFETNDENGKQLTVNNAIMLFPPRHPFLRECLQYIDHNYKGIEAANLSSPIMTTFLLKKYGLNEYKTQTIANVRLLPITVFYPFCHDEIFTSSHIKEDTMAIHHWAKTWHTTNTNIFTKVFKKLKTISYKLLPNDFFIYREYGLYGLKIYRKLKVQNGIFKGLKYAYPKAIGSSLMPKLVGTYEDILYPTIFEFSKNKYDLILNLGCGEGYYAVGLALLFTKTYVMAYDLNAKAIELTIENAKKNNISHYLTAEVKEFELDEKIFESKRVFIFCDIEGSELNLFGIENIEMLQDCDLIIELHDFMNFTIKPTLIKKFEHTHSIEVVSELNNDRIKKYDFLQKIPLEKSLKIVDEKRPETMEWLVLRSKKYYPYEKN